MFPPELLDLSRQTVQLYTRRQKRLVTAESCTGGLVAAMLTEIPGSSAVLDRGFVTYSNAAKIDLLGVLPDTLENYGAVSAECAEAMAEGALAYSQADTAIAITGIAGPDGVAPGKPVGLVFLAMATRGGGMLHYRCDFRGDRRMIRLQATEEALKLLLSAGEEN